MVKSRDNLATFQCLSFSPGTAKNQHRSVAFHFFAPTCTAKLRFAHFCIILSEISFQAYIFNAS